MIVQQEETDLAERLDCTDSIIMMKKGVNSYFKVSFFYSSDHDIILKKNIIMERVEIIKILVPPEVNLHQQSAKVSSIKATWEDTEEVQVTEEQQKWDGNISGMNVPTSKQREMARNVI